MKRALASLLLLVVVFVLPAASAGGQWPHDRQGAVLGFHLGGGSGQVEYAYEDVTAKSDRDGGVGFGLRAGYAFNSQFALTLEAAGVSGTSPDAAGSGLDINWTLTVATATLNWYPAGSGFCLRGGIGAANAGIDVDTGPFSVSANDDGLGVLLGAGYEWRLGQKFALGPRFDIGAMDLGDGLNANFATLSVGCNWYL